ncbi:MAG: HlyD family efflux transporter periplasmic adaptor subunit [Christensenellaceae bacterium]|nr:HlyD family efflux transporter periplasmic adaptor subunit [Christensenellaceae bacterium]
MKKILVFAAVMIAAISVIWLSSPKEPEVVCEEVTRGNICERIEIYGTVEPKSISVVTSTIDGIVDTLCFDQYDRVTRGQSVILLKSDDYVDEISRTERELDTIINNTRTVFSEIDQLSEEKEYALFAAQNAAMDYAAFLEAMKREEDTFVFNEIQSEYAADISVKKESLTAKRKELQKMIDQCTLTAESNGILIDILVKKGSAVACGQPVAYIADPDSLCVTAFVDEETASKLYIGMNLSFKASGSYKTFLGNITDIKDTFVQMETGNKLIPIEITPDSLIGLKTGAEAEIEIILQKKTKTLLIPIMALGKDKTVYILNTEGIIEERKVKTGISDGNMIEVISGLFEGEKLITELTDDVKSGVSAKEKRMNEQDN